MTNTTTPKLCKDCGESPVFLGGRCVYCDSLIPQEYFECLRGHSFCYRH
jgi:hypothetical protein